MAKLFTLLFVAFVVAINSILLQAEDQNNVLEVVAELDPVEEKAIVGQNGNGEEERGDRDKRFILKKIGFKAGLVHFVFGKIDSFIDAKTKKVIEFDKQNVIKNQKYFGITTPPPKPDFSLASTLFNVKKNLIGTAVQSLIQSKLSKTSGTFGHTSGSASFGPSGSGASYGGSASFGASAGANSAAGSVSTPSSVHGASFGAGASLPGLASANFATGGASLPPGLATASFGAGTHLPSLAGASFGAGAGTGAQGAASDIFGVTVGY